MTAVGRVGDAMPGFVIVGRWSSASHARCSASFETDGRIFAAGQGFDLTDCDEWVDSGEAVGNCPWLGFVGGRPRDVAALEQFENVHWELRHRACARLAVLALCGGVRRVVGSRYHLAFPHLLNSPSTCPPHLPLHHHLQLAGHSSPSPLDSD